MRHVLQWPGMRVAATACVVAAAACCPASAGEASPQALPPDAPPAAMPSHDADETGRAKAAQSRAAPAPDDPHEPPKGRKVLRLEALKDLPLLKRYELPLEKGEQLLADVEDNTFGYDESAFWWLVHLVNKMPAEAFDPGRVTTGYAQLLAMPSAYRGKPVTIKGVYVMCTPFQTPVLAVRKDVPTLYECNLRELPLEEQRPVATVVVLENPMEYLHRLDEVKVRGYFYKVRRYEKQQGGEGLAPMLVARRLVPQTQPAGRGPSSTLDVGSTNVLLAFMVGAILLLGIAYVFLRFRTKASPHAARHGTGHRFNLRRRSRDESSGDGGPGSEVGRPEP